MFAKLERIINFKFLNFGYKQYKKYPVSHKTGACKVNH